ncbi:NHL repeat-containing protein [Ralstonia chuxiongensis]|uniref:NHL repeat-containing protein n=1 Tax=Ralstonia chuxiongensis TaxID=2957504 RepID=UPI0028F59952|nr:NHL repeat-containing protein [Ralstonia chuxiongensis]CAJ0783391.1 Virginiamycin B lyase [Ralstonia chuxiongensis]
MKDALFNFAARPAMVGTLSLMLLSACGGGAEDTSNPVDPTYSIAGTVTGLATGAKVTLLNNGQDALQISASGRFAFPIGVSSSSRYAVTVGTQPVGQTCSVTNGDGVATADVSNVAVVCVDNPLAVSTLAGSGQPGSSNGSGTDASFKAPNSLAVDAGGNVYVADTGNNLIRKITPSGAVTTLAGSGSDGYVNGPAASASFSKPTGVAVDATGNVYVADWGNNRIRVISPDGLVATLAGSGLAGSQDGTGTAASFRRPYGVAVDAGGNVYVADSGSNLIRKISTNAVVSTLAGSGGVGGFADGMGSAASFSLPVRITLDTSGNAYVADFYNNRIRKVTPSGVVSTVAGSGSPGSTNGSSADASFNGPYGVAVDASGNVYVADVGNNLIRKVSSDGSVTTFAGSGSSGSSNGLLTQASFNRPQGVAVDSAGQIYIADSANNLIRKIGVSASN